jgi:hypothetical protein
VADLVLFADDWNVYPMEIPEGQLITGKKGTV